ncbi:MAG TPA: hypothetical protein VGI32_04885 [Steroidobacteraceae bacterium]
MRPIRVPLAAFLVFCAATHTARSDWIMAGSAALNHDNNVGNAENTASVVADSRAEATVSLFQQMPFGPGFSLAAGGDVSGQIYDHLSGLNGASLEGTLSLKKKWGLGAFAPWSRAGISVGRADYDDRYRDATLYSAALEAGKRLDDRWNLWAKYAFELRRAAPADSDLYGVSSDVFSQRGRSLKLGVQYSLSERVSLTLGSLLRHGDVISTTQAGATIFANSKAVAPDPTFGPEAYAYRLEGTTFGARLGMEYSLTAHSLIGLGFQRLDTHARGGNNYGNSMPELIWNYQF